MIDKHKKELNELTNKAKFIKNIIDKKLNVNGVKKDVIVSWLDEHDFDRIDDSYNYLLTMPIYSLTKERYEELLKKIGDKKEQIDDISKEDPKQMYLDDLNELKKKLK
jgi:DNA topoisomerase-2